MAEDSVDVYAFLIAAAFLALGIVIGARVNKANRNDLLQITLLGDSVTA